MKTTFILLAALLLAAALSSSAATITTYAGNGIADYTGDAGPATNAALTPFGLAVDPAGNLYVADANMSVVRRVDHATGLITTAAGTGTFGTGGDGGPATNALLQGPISVAADLAGNLYICD
jgi:hypothetical protein